MRQLATRCVLCAALVLSALYVLNFIIGRMFFTAQPTVLRVVAETLFLKLRNDQSGFTNSVGCWSRYGGITTKSSTEYFKASETVCLRENGPREVDYSLVELGYRRLGASQRALTSNCVMWSIINVMPKDAPANLPVILSRNIDVKKLPFQVNVKEMHRKVQFSPKYWPYPYRNYAVVVYADGKATVFRKEWGLLYRDLYRHEPMSTQSNTVLRYLMP